MQQIAHMGGNEWCYLWQKLVESILPHDGPILIRSILLSS